MGSVRGGGRGRGRPIVLQVPVITGPAAARAIRGRKAAPITVPVPEVVERVRVGGGRGRGTTVAIANPLIAPVIPVADPVLRRGRSAKQN